MHVELIKIIDSVSERLAIPDTGNQDEGISGQQNRARISDVDEPWSEYKIHTRKRHFPADPDQLQLPQEQTRQLAESTQRNLDQVRKWKELRLWSCSQRGVALL